MALSSVGDLKAFVAPCVEAASPALPAVTTAIPLGGQGAERLLFELSGPAETVRLVLYNNLFDPIREFEYGPNPPVQGELNLAHMVRGLPEGIYFLSLEAMVQGQSGGARLVAHTLENRLA